MGTRTYTRTKKEDEALMKSVCDEHNLTLSFYTENDGRGGYNYGAAAGDEIMIAPFVKTEALNTKVGMYTVTNVCSNPLECRLATFFHELAHAVLTKDLPMQCPGYRWNQTTLMQYEVWVTMTGLKYAAEHCKIVFSDETVMWLLQENMTYYHKDKLDDSRHTVSATDHDYTVSYDAWYEEMLQEKKALGRS